MCYRSLTPLSTIFQLYGGGQTYCWIKTFVFRNCSFRIKINMPVLLLFFFKYIGLPSFILGYLLYIMVYLKSSPYYKVKYHCDCN